MVPLVATYCGIQPTGGPSMDNTFCQDQETMLHSTRVHAHTHTHTHTHTHSIIVERSI